MSKALKIGLFIGIVVNLIVFVSGLLYFAQTFRGGRLDICSGTGEELFDLPAFAIGCL